MTREELNSAKYLQNLRSAEYLRRAPLLNKGNGIRGCRADVLKSRVRALDALAALAALEFGVASAAEVWDALATLESATAELVGT